MELPRELLIPSLKKLKKSTLKKFLIFQEMESSSYKIKKLFIFQEKELLSPSWKEKKTKKPKKTTTPRKVFILQSIRTSKSPKTKTSYISPKKLRINFSKNTLR